MSRLDRLSDLEESLSPTAIRRWLATQGWSLSAERAGVAETWTSLTPRGLYGIREVLLPLDREYADFGRRLKETLGDLRMAYDLSDFELAEQVAAVTSDLFFVRMQQSTVDATIPFVQATELMGSIQKMVRAAATSAANPRHSHRGRRPAEVGEFMEEDLRFGHTKRGSFIMTVAARLPVDDHTPASSTSPSSPNTPDDPIVPFQRRVMQTLATGLSATKRLAESPESTSFDLELAANEGVSLELVQSVVEFGEFDGVQQVDLTFDWAKQGPSAPAIEEISIASNDFPAIESMRGYMSRTEPMEDVTIIGRVAELAREDVGGGQEDLSVVVEADLFGKMRRVRVPLIDSDYDWAIYAHQRRLPFTVAGTPIKKRSWQLAGIVKADLTFLRAERQRRGD